MDNNEIIFKGRSLGFLKEDDMKFIKESKIVPKPKNPDSKYGSKS